MRFRRLVRVIGAAGLGIALQACVVRDTTPVNPGYGYGYGYGPSYQATATVSVPVGRSASMVQPDSSPPSTTIDAPVT